MSGPQPLLREISPPVSASSGGVGGNDGYLTAQQYEALLNASPGSGALTYSTVDALRAGTVPNANTSCTLLGYYEPGDGGGGEFYFDATSVDLDDGGLVFKPDSVNPVSPGRWMRNFSGRRLDVRWFGAVGDGDSHPLSEFFATLAAAQAVYPFATTLTDEIDWAAFQAAVNARKGVWASPTIRSAAIYVEDVILVINRTVDCEWTLGMRITGRTFGQVAGTIDAGGATILYTSGERYLNPSNTFPLFNFKTSYYFTIERICIAYTNPTYWGHIIEMTHRGGNTVALQSLLPSITFNGTTITRASGSFIDDGWTVGGTVHVQGSASNDAKTGVITAISALVITTAATTWTTETISFTGTNGLYSSSGDTTQGTIRDCSFTSTFATAGTGAKAYIAMTSAICCSIVNCAFFSAEIGILFRDFGGGPGVYSNAHVVRNCQFGYLKYCSANAGQDIVFDGCTFEALGGETRSAYSDLPTRTTAGTDCVFTFNAGAKTVTRTSGSWIVDGWVVGNAASYGSDGGFYGAMGNITVLTATVMTLDGTVPTYSGYDYYVYNDAINVVGGIPQGRQSNAERPCTLVVAGSTITRDTGSWITDGWVIGQTAYGFGGGAYPAIANMTATVLTLVSAAPGPGTYTSSSFYLRGEGGSGPLTFNGCWFGDQYRYESWLQLLGCGALNMQGNFFNGNARVLTSWDLLLKGSFSGNVLDTGRKQETILTKGTNGTYGLSITGNAGGCGLRQQTVNAPGLYWMHSNTPIVDGEAFQYTDDTYVKKVLRMTVGMLITTSITPANDTPASLLELRGGDIEMSTVGKSVIIKSPDGTRRRIQVDNAGVLSTAVV